MFDEAIDKAEGLLEELHRLAHRVEQESADTPEAAKLPDAEKTADEAPLPVAPVIPLPATPPVDADNIRIAQEGHDNDLPFKCPACGRTYEAQVTCTAGHPGELTLPTADVLAGAAPTDAETAAAAAPSPVAAADTDAAAATVEEGTPGEDGGDAPK